MTVTDDELTGIRDGLRALADRAEISDLIDRYVIALDTQDDYGFDDTWTRAIFTENARLEYPVGDFTGLEGLARFHYEAKAKFDRTHHLSSNHSISLHGGIAILRVHLIASHVHRADGPDPGGRFDIGGYCDGEAVRTEEGWRLRFWKFHLMWSAGDGPAHGPEPRSLRRAQPRPRPEHQRHT
jgi:hypothetical protein